MSKFASAVLASIAALAAASAASAQTAAPAPSPFAIGAHLGSTGAGAELFYGLSPLLTLRAGGDYGRLDHDLDSSDIKYKGRADWRTFDVAVDLHPFRNAFFVSGGVYSGERKVKVTANPSANVSINGVAFTPAQLGSIRGEASLQDASPFAGLGWDNTFHGANHWGFRALAGVAFSDAPDTNLVATGPFANDPRVTTYLRQEERQVRDDADLFKTYPVLQLGVNYRF